MKTIEYSGIGVAIADCLAEHAAQRFLEEPGDHIIVSTSNFVDAIRVLVKEGKFDHEEVQFVFHGQILPVDKDGRIEEWPAGFCDTTELILCRLLEQHSKGS